MNTVRRPVIGVTYPASPEAATKLLETPVWDEGRSGFRWITLANGDIGLIVFPQGDTFFDMETAFEADHNDAIANDTMSVLWAEDMGTVEVGPGTPPRHETIRWEDA